MDSRFCWYWPTIGPRPWTSLTTLSILHFIPLRSQTWAIAAPSMSLSDAPSERASSTSFKSLVKRSPEARMRTG